MKILETLSDIRHWRRHETKTIAFVPTMGNLHEGHLSLIDTAKKYAETVIVSIYVNSLQFGPNEDLDNYPRTLDIDLKLLESRNVEYVYLPSDIMKSNFHSSIKLHGLSQCLCGLSRPNFFEGITTILTKFFILIRPNYTILGKKDFQQYRIVKKLVEDLNFDMEVIPSVTVRNSDGLALSSRNSYLSKEEYEIAIQLNRILNSARNDIIQNNTEKDIIDIIDKYHRKIEDLSPHINIDYLEAREEENLNKIDTLEDFNKSATPVRLFLGLYLNNIRLIDNISLMD